MPFKTDWEKTSSEIQLPQSTIKKMVQLAFPNKKLISHELIAGGCVNLNIKIFLENEPKLFILRVYLRDKDAAFREQNLALLLKKTVPIPSSYYIGEMNDYHFAITEFISGITLRDLLLSDLQYDISSIMQDVGIILSNITVHKFPIAGFFDKELNVIPHTSTDIYMNLVMEDLKNEKVLSLLSPQIISNIKFYFDKYHQLFPEETDAHLVHSDFDPANILVDQINGDWKVSGILDWEFAFSSSILWDVANMLRYAHEMPIEFQEGFLKGLIKRGIELPAAWHITIQLLNLSSLLDLIIRSDVHHKHRLSDIRKLIDHILLKLENAQL